MKIIKQYHDYYDSAIGLAYDDRLIYDRKTERLEKSVLDMAGAGNIRAALHAVPSYGGYRASVRGCLLAFCGRIYPYWYLQDDFEKWPDRNAEPFYRGGHLLARLRRITEDPTAESAWKELADDALSGRASWRYGMRMETLEKFEANATGHAIDLEVFHALQCPSFLIDARRTWNGVHGYRIITNPRLAELNFGQHFDAFACFQEISTFLGGVLARTDETPRTVGDDRVVAQSKGFDDQSFRTLVSGQKKERRQLNRQRKRGA